MSIREISPTFPQGERGPRRLLPVTALAAMALALLALLPLAAQAAAPGTPDSVTVTRSDGSLTATWDAVGGATSYHVTYSTDGKASWTSAADDHPAGGGGTESITFAVDNANTYVVGVRAKNGDGGGGWRNSEPAGPYTPPQPPDAVASVSVARADGSLTASWDAPTGAASYHVTYSTDGTQSWSLAAFDHTGTSITFAANNGDTYVVGVRAKNAGGGSGWRNSSASGPYTPPTPTPAPTPEPTPTPTPDPARGIAIQDADGNPITSLAVPEGGEASYYVRLTAAPTEETKVCVFLSVRDKNDPDITFKGEADDVVSIDVIFTPGNWNTPQAVTLVAAEDDDYANGARDSGLDARQYYAGKVDLAVTEIDNDAPSAPAMPSSVAVARADGTLTVSGYAVTGATRYHVTYSSDGMQSWTSASDNHAGTSIEITGADNAETYVVGVRAGNDGGWSGWVNSASVGPYNPPAAPSGLTVTPDGNNLDVSWNAVTGATGYDVRSSTDGSSWTTEHSNVSATSASVANANGEIDYVAVRARNAGGNSDWTQVSRLPASDLLNTATGVASASGGPVMAAAQAEGASGQSNDVSAQAQLAAPVWGTITRNNNRLRGELNLNWTHSGWATGYNIVCSDTDGWSWNVCGWVDSNERAVYTTVPSSQSKPIKVTHYRRGSGSYGTPGDYALWRWRHYMVAIRAVNANPADASPWVNSEIIRPISGQLSNLTYTRTATSITLSWDPNYWTTGYTVYCGTYDATQSPYVEPSTVCATLTDQDDTQARHSVTLTSWTGGSIDNTSTWDIKIVSTNKWGSDGAFAPLIGPLTLSASSVTATGATLTIANHGGGAWYYKHTNTGATCDGPVAAGTSSKALTGLTAGTSYTFSAYSDSTCTTGNLLATASQFTTPSLTASNVGTTTARITVAGHTGQWWYMADTGPHTTCQGPVASGTSYKDLTGLTAGSFYVYSAYSATGCADTVKLASAGVATAVTVSNLSADNSNTSFGNGQNAQGFTTGNADATLLSVTVAYSNAIGSGHTVTLRDAQSNGKPDTTTTLATLTGTPVSGGDHKFTCVDGGSNDCSLEANTTYFIYASGGTAAFRSTAADTETLQPAGNGWSIEDAARQWSDGNLVSGSEAMKIQVEAVPHEELSASSVTATGATLTINRHIGAWWYKSATTGKTDCTSAGSGSSATVSGLTADTAYVFTAYSDSSCTTSIAAAPSFTTPLASPTGVVASASKGGVSVTWTATGVDKAQVRTRTSGGNWTAAVDPVGDANASPARIIGLTPGTAVDVQLRTVKGTKNSAWVSGGNSITPSATTAPSGKATNVNVSYADSKFWVRFDFPANFDDGGLALDYQFSGNIGGLNSNLDNAGFNMTVGSEADKTHSGTTYDVVYWFDQWRHSAQHSHQWQSICVSGRDLHVKRVNILIKNTLGNSGWHAVNLNPYVYSGCD